MTDLRLLVFLEELQRHPIDLAEFRQERGASEEPAGRARARAADRGAPARRAVRRLDARRRCARRRGAAGIAGRGGAGLVSARRRRSRRRVQPLGRPPHARPARAPRRSTGSGPRRGSRWRCGPGSSVLAPCARRCGAGSRSWRCRSNAALGCRLLYDTVDGSGTRPATARPISASTPSARPSPRSTAPRCSTGSTTAREGFADTEAFLDRRLDDLKPDRRTARPASTNCWRGCPTRSVCSAGALSFASSAVGNSRGDVAHLAAGRTRRSCRRDAAWRAGRRGRRARSRPRRRSGSSSPRRNGARSSRAAGRRSRAPAARTGW